MEKLTALFYSSNANSNLASKVKNTLNKFNYFTIYVQDIDDIILKKFSNINFLVLDFTENVLDKTLFSLIMKLVDLGYIKRIVIITFKDLDKIYYNCPIIAYDSYFNEKFPEVISKILTIPTQDLKVCDSLCVKVIGNYLTSIGFSLRHIGYSMLIDTITYVYANNCAACNLNKDIYVYLANKYNKTISSIEMNLRKSITLAYRRNKNFPFEHSPTNKEFITYTITELYDKIYANKIV